MDDSFAARLRAGDPAVIGRRIRDRRLARALTQADVAGEEWTVSFVSKIESGQRRPSVRMCSIIAARLGMTVEYLITGVDANQVDEARLSLRYAELSLESGEAIEAELRTAEFLRQHADSLPTQAIEARYLHARALEALGRLDEAIIDLETVVDGGPTGERWLTAAIALSRCLRESGDFSRAIEVGEFALNRLSESGLAGGDEAVQLTVTVAFAHFIRGDTGHAVRMCRAAIGAADALGSATARGSAYWNASVFESGRGSTEIAIPLAERALALLAEGADVRNLARLRLQLGIMLLRLDPPRYVEALADLKQARGELANSSASPVDVARCDIATARALLAAGDRDAARELATTVHAARAQLAPTVAADLMALLGQIAASDGQQDLARLHYQSAVAQLTGVGADRDAAQLWLELGALLDQAGDAEAARDAYLRAAVSTGLRAPANLMPVTR